MLHAQVKYMETTESNGISYRIPYWEIDSNRPGPSVLITAALHGTELNGCEVIRRLMPIARRSLIKGRCLLLPLANLRAIQKHQQNIEPKPSRTKRVAKKISNSINCLWPGDPAGSSAQRASFAMKETLVDRATHNIDIHSWNHTWAAGVLARNGYEPSLSMARATGMRFARHMDWMPEKKKRPVLPCTLTSYFNDTGRAAICIELSGQNIIDPSEVRTGLRALRNCLRFLKMLPGGREKGDTPQIWLNDARATEVNAPCSGLFVKASSRMAAPIKAGARLGWMLSDETLQTRVIRAPASGYLHKHGCLRIEAHDNARHHVATHPYVNKGELLAQIVAP